MPEKDPIAELAQQLASSLARRELLPSSDPGFCAAILLEVTNSFALKQQAARALAAAESDTAFALALNVLTNAPSSSRAAMAEALGHSQRPESRTLLESLLTGADEAVARGAVRGVAARASPDALNQLGAMLVDGWDLPLSVRTEAALCLGGLDDPAATDVLKAAALEVKNTTVAKHVLAGLGNRPFAETESFYTAYLSDAQVSKELRVCALESLSGNDVAAGWFLLGFASQNADPEVRAAAAWAMSNAEEPGSFGADLVGMLRTEGDPEVRRRLYQALRNQSNCDVQELVQLLQADSEQRVRLAAFDTLASAMPSTGTTYTAAFFNQVATPELLQAALADGSDASAIEAVMTLRKARSSASLAALQQIAGSSENPKVAQAARSAVEAAMRMRQR
jgi:HEAT repeat protein